MNIISRRLNSSKPNDKTSQRGPVTYFTLGLTGLVGAGILVYYGIEKERKTERITSSKIITTGKPALGGPWSLVDQDGIPRNSVDYLGKFTLLYFGFTHCPDICPSELVKVGKIMKEIGKIR
jgi:protein SCO1/2